MTGATCDVYVDGVRLADGSATDDPTAPNALSPLVVAWGRSTTVDQPDPSTCTLSILDPAGGPSFVGQLRTGARLRVESTGTSWSNVTVQTFTNPGFEAGTVTWDGYAALSTTRANTGTHSLKVATEAGGPQVTLFPAERSNTPGAWDAIPRATAGQSWTFRLRVWCPIAPAPGYSPPSILVRPVAFASPVDGAPVVIVAPNPVQALTPGWQTVERTFTIPDAADGRWVGLRVASPVNVPKWNTIDPTLTWGTIDPTLTWAELAGTYLDDVEVLAPAGGITRTVLVFEGRVTDVKVSDDDGPTITVAAVDFAADLDNRDVGGAPWPVEELAARFDRILALSGLDVEAYVDTPAALTLVSWQDVDSKPAAGLLRNLAASVDATMWPAVHATTGPYLRVEDGATRESLYELVEGPDGVVRVVSTGGRIISACDVLAAPVSWVQDVADISTRVAVTWLEQTLDDNGNEAPTERTVTVVDPALEAELGTRRISVATVLVSVEDANRVAGQLLARTAVGDWRADGITIDDDDVDATHTGLVLTLLDGTSRIGLPVRLTDLPAWAPVLDVPVYVEGGSYRFESGRWVLSMTLSRAIGQGASVTWAELDPTWTWADFDPAMTWEQLRGTSAATTRER